MEIRFEENQPVSLQKVPGTFSGTGTMDASERDQVPRGLGESLGGRVSRRATSSQAKAIADLGPRRSSPADTASWRAPLARHSQRMEIRFEENQPVSLQKVSGTLGPRYFGSGVERPAEAVAGGKDRIRRDRLDPVGRRAEQSMAAWRRTILASALVASTPATSSPVGCIGLGRRRSRPYPS
jgi:hypothetical protein